MKSITSKNIVFVTGAFVNNTCWDDWKSYFESRGYTTTAPPWPFKEGTTTALRNRRPEDVDLALLTLGELVDYYAALLLTSGSMQKPIPYWIIKSLKAEITLCWDNRVGRLMRNTSSIGWSSIKRLN